MADIFISYSQKDRDIAKKLAAVLEGNGFTVWWDYDLVGGVKFRQEINRELASAGAVIVLWSEYSVVSDWVLDEAEEAKASRKLVPVRLPNLDYRSIPLGFRSVQTELADQPDRIVLALNGLGLKSSQQASEKTLDDYWNLIAQRIKPPGFLSRRSAIGVIAGGAIGVASTLGYQAIKAKRYLVRDRAIHQGRITGIVALPDGKSAISAGEDGAVTLSSVLTGDIESALTRTGNAVTSVAFSEAYKSVYCTHKDGSVNTWSLDRKGERIVSALDRGPASQIQLVGLLNEKVAAILLENGDVLRCSYDERGVVAQTSYTIGAKAISALYVPFLTPDCIVAFAKGATADIIALDKEGGRSLGFIRQDLSGHDAPITQIRTIWRQVGSRDRHVYSFTASDDATIRCGDHYSRKMLYSLPGHLGSVTTMTIFDRGPRIMLASSGIDGTLKIWDAAERKLMKDFGAQPVPLTSLAFTTEGAGLLAGTAQGRLQYWEIGDLLEPRGK